MLKKLIIEGKIYREPERNGSHFMVDCLKRDKLVNAKTFRYLYLSCQVGNCAV